MWRTLSGDELSEQYARREPLEDMIPPCQAIYIWRRSFRPPASALSNLSVFGEWIDNCMTIPIAVLEDKRLSHYAELERFVLGGQGLGAEKQQTLRRFEVRKERRRALARFVTSLSAFSPALYVGESNNLPQRVRDHLRGDTGLKETLDGLGVDWAQTEFLYYVLREQVDNEIDKSIRTLFETIATSLCLSGCVKRIG